VQVRQSAKRPQIRVLRGVLGKSAFVEDAFHDRIRHAVCRRNEASKCVEVARLCPFDELPQLFHCSLLCSARKTPGVAECDRPPNGPVAFMPISEDKGRAGASSPREHGWWTSCAGIHEMDRSPQHFRPGSRNLTRRSISSIEPHRGSTVSTPVRLQPRDPSPPLFSQDRSGAAGLSRALSWTPHHVAILEWAEPRQGTDGHARPEIDGVSPFRVDEFVADLVGHGLLKAIAVPRHPKTNVPAHWEPTTLTVDGKKWLFEHRRKQPKPTPSRNWIARLLGFGR
jgi:hypothetical protein